LTQTITTDLAAVLSTVRRPGDFFVSRTTELLAPLLEVDGIGPIALPQLPMQAEQLVAVAQRAPYCRGEDPGRHGGSADVADRCRPGAHTG
jgi:hypothetical protein